MKLFGISLQSPSNRDLLVASALAVILWMLLSWLVPSVTDQGNVRYLVSLMLGSWASAFGINIRHGLKHFLVLVGLCLVGIILYDLIIALLRSTFVLH